MLPLLLLLLPLLLLLLAGLRPLAFLLSLAPYIVHGRSAHGQSAYASR